MTAPLIRRSIAAFISLLLLFLAGKTGWTQVSESCVTFHQSFDNQDYLKDDYSAQFEAPEFEDRHLKPVPGKFGPALLNDNRFVPEDFAKTYFAAMDLDTLHEVIFHHYMKYWVKGPYDNRPLQVGGMQPYFWGTGRVKTDGGTVAFWAKGARTQPGWLFFQGSSSYGRKEKELLAIQLNEDNSLEAFVRDARYVYHRIKSAPGIWNQEQFNHVALRWDRSQGLSLSLNGREIASNWGTDAWWATQIPGLFHFPMCGVAVDELWIFDRALASPEIQKLMRTNTPPSAGRPPVPDRSALQRLRESFIAAEGEKGLPVARPSAGGNYTEFTEIYPEWAGDGIVNANQLMDGKYEYAWPSGYNAFTGVLGDSDFQATKLDVRLPSGAAVNYITLEGNLTDAKLLAGNGPDDSAMRTLFEVPKGRQLFHGGMIEPVTAGMYRIPFLKGYGSPEGYAPGMQLPLTGDISIHEAGFFQVNERKGTPPDAPGSALSLKAGGTPPSDARYGYALRTMNDRRNGAVLDLGQPENGAGKWTTASPLSRLNLLAPPVTQAQTLRAVSLNLKLRKAPGGFAVLRLHDPGVPARIWDTLVFRLDGFDSPKGGALSLRLDCMDIRLAPGDRVWMDLLFSDSAEIAAGGKDASTVTLETAPLAEADPRYAFKELQPALGDFAKIYVWYYPWIQTRVTPKTEEPVTFGGWYDIVTCPLIVRRTLPDDFTANALYEIALIPYSVTLNPANVAANDVWEYSPKYWPKLPVVKADDTPDWAFFMHYYLTRFEKIVHWWADRQNPDGQVGGGWNDDVIFTDRLMGPFLFLGDQKGRDMFDRIFEGFYNVKLFEHGTLKSTPIDLMHVFSIVANRYEGLVFDPGNPRKMKVAMETAWHKDKPQETPVNYFNGEPYGYDAGIVNWWWGRTPKPAPWSAALPQVTDTMRKYAPGMNDIIEFRYTESGMFTDGAYMPGVYEIKPLILGGSPGAPPDQLTMAVSWEDGCGATVPRWVEAASDSGFTAHLYSCDSVPRDISARLLRLKKGVYRITLAGEGKDAGQGVLFSRTRELRRFSLVSVPVSPGRECKLTMELMKALPCPEELPDLAVDELKVEGGQLKAEVLNFGNAAANSVTVGLEDSAGRVIERKTVTDLKDAKDFIWGRQDVSFAVSGLPSGVYRVVADPDNALEEIYKGNNSAGIEVRKER